MSFLEKSFKPDIVEEKWYSFWEKKRLFTPEEDSNKPPYCIVIPPPNVTGSLHMGHALNVTLQDILIRWKKMSGYNTLWIVGTDHAGIATQNVVEKELAKEGLDRYALGRDDFIKRVWKWKNEYGNRITHQLKKLGCACDWTRERFTLDEGLSKAVREVFVRLFEEGLLYRENRLINWCPRCHTALSELEVEHEETDGNLYFIKYPLVGEDYSITVATTRPETMLGDTAVAVNPDDPRYSHLIGKWVYLPLTNRRIKIIADPSVDPSFGTGVLKITPAHDFNDEIIAKRHGLSFVTVIDEDGYMTENAGSKYKGLERYECRKRVIQDLAEKGLLVDRHKHVHSVGRCYRCRSIIEPLLSVQWYVKIDSLASEAIKAVEEGKINLIPDIWLNNYFAWMRDIKDWCISRQIWWGHQIPVWYCPDCQLADGRPQGDIIEHILYKPLYIEDNKPIVGGTYSYLRKLGISHEDIIKNSKIIRIPKEIKPLSHREDLQECLSCKSKNLIHDPDVLDTWFSSALWPFSTLGWPDRTKDLQTFYPTNVLVTAFDILFFWVARMIMMGLKFMKEVPFKDVYIHAIVRDVHGQKMSKSKGNVIDPLILINKYGTDSFRFALASFASQGRDIKFSEKRVEGYRHFINKLWNATQFVLRYSFLKTDYDIYKNEDKLDLPSKWILSRLAKTVEEVNRELKEYRFNDAANAIYQFVWHEFCDWYLEITKPTLYKEDHHNREVVANCLFHVLKTILLLLHPFIPFVTEELWNSVFKTNDSIMNEKYPSDMKFYPEAEEEMSYFIDAVLAIRHIRGELNIAPSLEINADIKTHSERAKRVLKNNLQAILKLTKCKNIRIGEDLEKSKDSAIAIRKEMEIYLPISGLIDIEAEMSRLLKEMAKIEDELNFVNKKLMNEDFLKNAPPDIVEKEQEKLNILIERGKKLRESINILKTI